MKKLKKVVFLIALILSSMGMISKGQAAFISPTKIFIHDGQSTATLSISNMGDEALVYTFEWERRMLSKDGKTVTILNEGETAEGYDPADPYLVYSPRRVVVQPGETQRLRIFVRRPKDMAPGEYRSHLKISSDSLHPKEKPVASASEFGGVISVRTAVSIPVMLRTGKTEIKMDVLGSNIIKNGADNAVKVDIVNHSTRSIYGKSVFKCKLAGSGEVTATKSNGFRLYKESETLSDLFTIPSELDISKCSELNLELLSTRDPEYKDEPVATVKVK